jgi:hypothetical protein
MFYSVLKIPDEEEVAEFGRRRREKARSKRNMAQVCSESKKRTP